MELHEKSLELNITHELLVLADSWLWFFTDLPLWRYWRPIYRLPFFKYPTSIAAGFHITTEGRNDPTGEAGGGYDVRIKAGLGRHLLFIQYKKGDFVIDSPDARSIFANVPSEHYMFHFNSTRTNQHFTLRDLSDGIGNVNGNAVVYAFPLIADMEEMEKHAGKLLRRTKFISIKNIDEQAEQNDVEIERDKEHKFRICALDMNRCEVNFSFFSFKGQDRTKDVIADAIAIRFQKNLSSTLNEIIEKFGEYKLDFEYIGEGLRRAFGEFLRYLLHYFEINPYGLNQNSSKMLNSYFDFNSYPEEFTAHQTQRRDIEIVNTIFEALYIYHEYIQQFEVKKGEGNAKDIPEYQSSIFISDNNDIKIDLNGGYSKDEIEKIGYIII